MNENRKHRISLLLIAALLIGLLAGCGSSREGGSVESGPVDAGEEVMAEYPVRLYYVATAYIETGDETIEPMVMSETTLVMETEDEDQRYEEALELLADVKVDGVELDGADTMVRHNMVADVAVGEDGLAVVDFNGDMMHGGSMEEVYLIEQVVRTLVGSFDEIQRVRFTVEGNQVESLMGHLEANCTYGLITVEEDGKDVELVSILNE